MLSPADLLLMAPVAYNFSSWLAPINNKLRIGIIGAGEIVRARHLPALKKHPEVEIVAVSNSTYESAQKFCEENAPERDPAAELGRPPRDARYRYRLDRHAALHAFGGDGFRARSRETRLLSGADGDGSGRGGGDAGDGAAFSGIGHDALPAAVWFARRSAREKTARGKLHRPSAPHPAAMFHRCLFECRSARRIGGSGSKSAG